MSPFTHEDKHDPQDKAVGSIGYTLNSEASEDLDYEYDQVDSVEADLVLDDTPHVIGDRREQERNGGNER